MSSIQSRRLLAGAARFAPVVCILILGVCAFWAQGTCFSGDDFNNLYWAQLSDGRDLLKAAFNPFTLENRPAGILMYWTLLKGAGLAAGVYQGIAWGIHAINATLVYSLLRLLLRSPAGAAVGALLFGYRANFLDVYWGFGTVFELLAALFFFSTFRLCCSRQPRAITLPVVCVLYTLATNAKEMAITLPAILILWELCLGPACVGRNIFRSTLQRLLPLGVVCAIGLAVAARRIGYTDLDANGPLHLTVTASALGQSLGWYLDVALGTSLPWQVWSVFVPVSLAFLWRRNRCAFFLMAYVLVTFLPVIFLVNHRFPFYWYIPMLGLAGLAGMLARDLWRLVHPHFSFRVSALAGIGLFAALSTAHFQHQLRISRAARVFTENLCREHTSFTEEIRTLPRIEQGEVLYFTSVPFGFNEEILRSAVQVSLRRTDIDAKLVKSFPPDAKHRLRFENSRIVAEAP